MEPLAHPCPVLWWPRWVCWKGFFSSVNGCENTHPGSCHVSVLCWALPCCIESSSFLSNYVECVASCIDLKLLPSVASCRRCFDLSSLFKMKPLCYLFVICTMCYGIVLAGEMTFELPDSVKQCFYEHIEKNVKCTLEYQVSSICVLLQIPFRWIIIKKNSKPWLPADERTGQ